MDCSLIAFWVFENEKSREMDEFATCPLQFNKFPFLRECLSIKDSYNKSLRLVCVHNTADDF